MTLDAAGGSELELVTTLDQFQQLMLALRTIRRRAAIELIYDRKVCEESVESISCALRTLEASTVEFKRTFASPNGGELNINLSDEILSLRKDLSYIGGVVASYGSDAGGCFDSFYAHLASYHPVSVETFTREVQETEALLRGILNRTPAGKIDVFITDWDGTMKTYCSTYSTCMQPLYSAVLLARFAERFTVFAAVLTAGPLYDTGILDLVCVPDGYLTFGGSWGQEWVLDGKHYVNDHSLKPESKEALRNLTNHLSDVYDEDEFSRFRLVGSGFQRKIDRVTIGHQNVSNDITDAQNERWMDRVMSEVDRVDSDNAMFIVKKGEYDLELILRKFGTAGDSMDFNKADGIKLVCKDRKLDIASGSVLICGDTASDIPMVRYAASMNPQTCAMFVNSSASVREELGSILPPSQLSFVSCPEVFHVAIAKLCS